MIKIELLKKITEVIHDLPKIHLIIAIDQIDDKLIESLPESVQLVSYHDIIAEGTLLQAEFPDFFQTSIW